MPVGVDLWRNLGGFDLGAAAPEDVGVADGNAFCCEVFVDGGLVLHDLGFLGAVHHAHDIDVAKARSTFAPVGMGHAVMAADFGSGLLLHPLGDGPVEETIKAGYFFAGVGRFDVFEEGGEAANHFLGVEGFGDFAKTVEGDARDLRRACPSSWKLLSSRVSSSLRARRTVHSSSVELDGGRGHHLGGSRRSWLQEGRPLRRVWPTPRAKTP